MNLKLANQISCLLLISSALVACGGGGDNYTVEGGGDPAVTNPPPEPPVDPVPEPSTERVQKIISGNLNVNKGDSFSLPLQYKTEPENVDLAGLAVRVHWASQDLNFVSTSQTLMTSFLGEGQATADLTDLDNDPQTDMYMVFSWANFPEGKWPNTDTWPVALTQVEFEALASGATQVNFSASSTAGGYQFSADAVQVTIE